MTLTGRVRGLYAPLFWAVSLLALAQTASTLAQGTSKSDSRPVQAPAQYRFDSWTTDDGLPQNSVVSILQTSDGYLWMTTFDGLVRYDGVRFKVFNSVNTPGIRNTRFVMLYEDSDRNLWVATEENGITLYRDGRFTTYTTEEGLPHNRISRKLKLREDSSGLVINTDGGPVRWKNGKLLPGEPGDREGYVATGFPARPGVIWFVDRMGLHRVENGQVTAVVPSRWSSPDEIRAIFETPTGAVWISTPHPKGELWRLSNGRITLMTGKDGLPGRWITSICEDRNGNTWIGTADAGLYLFKGDRITAFTTADGLSSDHIASIYEDREGNIWIGTQNGLNRLGTKTVVAFSKKDGLAADNVYPIYQDRSGDIWIGAWSGLTRYSNGAFTDYSKLVSLENGNVTALCEDRDGGLWIGMWGTVVRLRDGTVTRYTSHQSLFNNAVHAIYEDRAGTLWFGTHRGLVRYENPTFTTYTRRDGLAGEIVYVLLEDRDGALWFGTERGLSVYRNGEFRSYTAAEGLPAHMVRALHQDNEGTLWIGTYDAGLYRFRDGRFAAVTTRDGLFNNGVFQILDDGLGYFWMSCNLGIYRVARKELEDFFEGRVRKIVAIPYGKREGMLNQECNGGNQPAGIKAADGRLWFPTVNGVAVIDPATINVSFQPPTVVIDEVTIDNKPVTVSSELRIEPGRQSFNVTYAGLSFIDPARIEFRYRLIGLDSDWIEAGTRRTAYYSHVAPGAYTFEVVAANRDGVWSEHPAQIRIVVVPPFWRTWWFTLLIVSAVVAAAVLLYSRRILVLKRAHAAQEAFSRQLIESQEAERKRIAAELHDSLGQNLLVIKNRVMLAMRAANDGTLEQLTEVSSATDLAIDEVSEISYNLRPYHLDRLGLARAIEVMLRRVSGSSGIRFSTDIDELGSLLDQGSEISLYRIVQESVNNIVKHSMATEAQVSIKKNVGDIEIKVRDNGRGIDRDSQSSEMRSAGGFGLIDIAERVKMLGGRHSLQSVRGAGTTITVQISLPERKDEDED